MRKIFILIMLFIFVLGCSFNNEEPDPYPTPPVQEFAKIGVTQNGVEISDMAHFRFPDTDVDTGGTLLVFSIQNRGNVPISWLGNPLTIQGPDVTSFNVTQPVVSIVPVNGSTQFSVLFDPVSIGLKSVQLTIDYRDNQNYYIFTLNLSGTGTTPDMPQMEVYHDDDYISPDEGKYTFSDTWNNREGESVTFTIENNGIVALDLTGTPVVGLTGDTADFIVEQQPENTFLAPGNSVYFSIKFTPHSLGVKTAAVSIANDSIHNPYTFTVEGESVVPDMQVSQNNVDIDTPDGEYNFPAVVAGASSEDVIFTISNNGSAALEFPGTPYVQLTGDNPGDFELEQPSADTLNRGESMTFILRFAPETTGPKSAVVSIPNTDPHKNPYTFTVTGTGSEVALPEIEIRQDMTTIPSGTGNYDFLSVEIDEVSPVVTFTIKNSGFADLELTGIPIIVVSGSTSDFAVTQPGSSTLGDGASTTFTVQFTPQSLGPKTVLLSIASNDNDENPYTFTVSGTAIPVQEAIMGIKEGANVITNGGQGYSYPSSVEVGTSGAVVIFTVQNTGNINLQLTGAPAVTVTSDAADFTVTQPGTSVIGAGLSTTFTVRFTPVTVGSKNVQISIASNDADNNPFTFFVTGTAIPVQEAIMGIKEGTNVITNGGQGYSYPSVEVGTSGAVVTFTVQNTGNISLQLTGIPAVAVTGNTSDFTITQPGTSVIGAGLNTTFTVQFTPLTVGAKNLQINITNNDADNSPFTFSVTGTALPEAVPEIEVKEGLSNTVLAHNDAFHFNDCIYGYSSSAILFTIRNAGYADLLLLGSPYVDITGADADDFAVTQPASGTVAQGTSTTFTITFTPQSPGSKNATITISNNDSDEGSFSFTISGTCLVVTPSFTSVSASASNALIKWSSASLSIKDGFRIEKQDADGGGYTEIASVGSAVTSYTDTDIITGKSYLYRIRAYYGSGYSGYSQEKSFVLPYASAPAGFTAETVSYREIHLSWTASAYTYGNIIVERSSGGTYYKIATLAMSATEYLASGLSAATYYTFRIKFSSAYSSSAYVQSSAQTPIQPPATPTDFICRAYSSSIGIGWYFEASTAYEFHVERRTGETGTFELVATVDYEYENYGSYGFYDYDIEPGVTYYYRVAAVNDGGLSEYTAPLSAVILRVPENVSLSAATVSSLTLTWDAVTGAGGYHVYSSTSFSGTYTKLTATGEVTTTTYTYSGLTAGTQYYFKIRACNGSLESADSDIFSATTLMNPPAFTVASTDSTKAVISITGYNALYTYRVYRSLTETGTYGLLGTAGGAAFTDSSVVAGNIYYYKATMENTSGESALSTSRSVAVMGIPDGLSFTGRTLNSLTLEWNAVANAAQYKIYRSTETDSGFANITTVTSGTSYTDSGLSTGTYYYYKILALSSGGSISSYSATVHEVTVFNYTITNIQISSTPTTITFTWNYVPNVELYYVYLSTEGGPFEPEGSTAGGVTTLTISRLAVGDYEVQITGYTCDGEGGAASKPFTVE